MPTLKEPTTDDAKLASLAYMALARELTSLPAARDEKDGLGGTLRASGWTTAAALADQAVRSAHADAEGLRWSHDRIFNRSMPPPYETTYTSGGSTPDLADIAGFYRAFGVDIEGEKPDHVVAELEYLAILALREARAADAGRPHDAETCRNARRAFIREHAGCWLDALADRIQQSGLHEAHALLVRAAARAVEADARALGVTPVASGAPRPPAPGIPGPDVDLDTPPCAIDPE
jgi:TorA maturation chaperone TorD